MAKKEKKKSLVVSISREVQVRDNEIELLSQSIEKIRKILREKSAQPNPSDADNLEIAKLITEKQRLEKDFDEKVQEKRLFVSALPIESAVTVLAPAIHLKPEILLGFCLKHNLSREDLEFAVSLVQDYQTKIYVIAEFLKNGLSLDEVCILLETRDNIQSDVPQKTLGAKIKLNRATQISLATIQKVREEIVGANEMDSDELTSLIERIGNHSKSEFISTAIKIYLQRIKNATFNVDPRTRDDFQELYERFLYDTANGFPDGTPPEEEYEF